jgi:hypothetical protein
VVDWSTVSFSETGSLSSLISLAPALPLSRFPLSRFARYLAVAGSKSHVSGSFTSYWA